MACKYLTGVKIARCLATDGLMVPSLMELAVFCNADHEACSFYREREATDSMRKPVQAAVLQGMTEQKSAKAG